MIERSSLDEIDPNQFGAHIMEVTEVMGLGRRFLATNGSSGPERTDHADA
jgi:hypothetical protein